MTVMINGGGLEGIGLATGGSGSGANAVPLYAHEKTTDARAFTPPVSDIAPRASSWKKNAK